VRRSFLALAVALPLVVLALGIVRSERHLAEGRRWSFDVTGYDPRDLLRGHYIQYRLALDEVDLAVYGAGDGAPCDDDSGDDCCLCLYADYPKGPTSVERTACQLAFSECDGALRTRYLGELQRYYIAEERAQELTEIFQDASRENRSRLIVAIDKTGKPQIDVLLVDDMPVEQARRPSQPAAMPDDDSTASDEGDARPPTDGAPSPARE
jgi:uncharacterized membrane-anchored protein